MENVGLEPTPFKMGLSLANLPLNHSSNFPIKQFLMQELNKTKIPIFTNSIISII